MSLPTDSAGMELCRRLKAENAKLREREAKLVNALDEARYIFACLANDQHQQKCPSLGKSSPAQNAWGGCECHVGLGMKYSILMSRVMKGKDVDFVVHQNSLADKEAKP